MTRPFPEGLQSERNSPASLLRLRQGRVHCVRRRGRVKALLTGYREYVLEASVHSRRFVLIHYAAPDTK